MQALFQHLPSEPDVYLSIHTARQNSFIRVLSVVEVARRHGEASPEMRQAKQLLASTDQLYFDFGATPAKKTAPRAKAVVKPKKGGGRQVGAH